jgi:hypothetical protein
MSPLPQVAVEAVVVAVVVVAVVVVAAAVVAVNLLIPFNCSWLPLNITVLHGVYH